MAFRKFLILRSPPVRDAACGGSSGQGWRLEGRTAVDPVARFACLAALAVTLFMGGTLARADDLASAVAGLGGDSFAAKEKAIGALGKLGDPRAVPILKALSEDRLRKAPDARVVIINTV